MILPVLRIRLAFVIHMQATEVFESLFIQYTIGYGESKKNTFKDFKIYLKVECWYTAMITVFSIVCFSGIW